jgi:probable rRNA maturation factor
MAIRFFNENTLFTIRNRLKIRKWIENVIKLQGLEPGEINIILCDDDYLSKLNIKYLRHNTLTDILTFQFDSSGNRINGEIYISLPRVKENAETFGKTLENELHRVMIHGVLHLSGHLDKSKIEKEEMRRREDHCLSLLNL